MNPNVHVARRAGIVNGWLLKALAHARPDQWRTVLDQYVRVRHADTDQPIYVRIRDLKPGHEQWTD